MSSPPSEQAAISTICQKQAYNHSGSPYELWKTNMSSRTHISTWRSPCELPDPYVRSMTMHKSPTGLQNHSNHLKPPLETPSKTPILFSFIGPDERLEMVCSTIGDMTPKRAERMTYNSPRPLPWLNNLNK